MAGDAGPQPDAVWSVGEFAAELRVLVQGAGSLRQVVNKASALVARSRRGVGGAVADLEVIAVSHSALSRYIRGEQVPPERALRALLLAVGVTSEKERSRWFAARSRALSSRRPQGAVLVADAAPHLLGVKKAISAGPPTVTTRARSTEDDFLPVYVERDADLGPGGLHDLVKAAGRAGGFIVLVGGSSVGKSRSAYEAVRRLLPKWWLLHPPAGEGMAELRSLAAAPAAHTVVWLDDLQRYLGPGGLGSDLVRALLRASEPILLLGTMWPRRPTARPGWPPDASAEDAEDAEDAEVQRLMALARIVRISDEFSRAETARAVAAAEEDARIVQGMVVPGYSLPQALAAVPELVDRWEDAQLDVRAGAVLTAGVDLARIGVHGPLTRELLRAAAAAYLTGTDAVRAPETWFDEALSFATQPLHGGAAALEPAAGPPGTIGPQAITGYTLSPYLRQHTQPLRADRYLPQAAWQAVVDLCADPDSIARAVECAGTSGLDQLRDALEARGRQLPESAHNRPSSLPMLDSQQEELRLLQATVAAGDALAARNPVGRWLIEGRVEELRPVADAGDGTMIYSFAAHWSFMGQVDEARRLLRPRADAGDEEVRRRLADLLAEWGPDEELRARAEAGDRPCGQWLMQRLDPAGQLTFLTSRADAGDNWARTWLARMLFQQGRTEELRRRADTGDPVSAYYLALILRQDGKVEELRARADRGAASATFHLARLLLDRGQLTELRARARTGDPHATQAVHQHPSQLDNPAD